MLHLEWASFGGTVQNQNTKLEVMKTREWRLQKHFFKFSNTVQPQRNLFVKVFGDIWSHNLYQCFCTQEKNLQG